MPCYSDLVKERRNQLVPLGKLLSSYHNMVQKHCGLLSALPLPLDHLVHVSSSSSTAKPEGFSTGSWTTCSSSTRSGRYKGVLSSVLLVVSVAQAIHLIAGNVPLGSPPHRAPGQADGVLLSAPLAGDELGLELPGTTIKWYSGVAEASSFPMY